MSAKLKKMQLESELAGVIYGRLQLQVKIQERLDDVARLQQSANASEAKELELKMKLSEMSDDKE